MKSILLVEDEALIAMEEAQCLRREGYAVEHVLSGEHAIDAVRNHPDQVDLILMDIDLGRGIDGTIAAQEILKTYDIPILFVSSHTEKEIVDKTEKITSYGYVVKNSGDVVLLASVKMAFRLHQAHNALAASEEKYSKAFHTSPDSININRLSDGIYLAVNEGFTLITGYTPEEVLGKSSVEPTLHIWEDNEDRLRLLDMLQRTGQANNLEAKFRMKNGDVRYGLMSARVLTLGQQRCILSFTRDISDRREAQQALAASNETLTSLVNASPLAIIGSDKNAKILLWNPAAEKLFGWAAKEVIGRPNPIVPPERSQEFDELTARIRAGEQITEHETTRLRKDGSRIEVSLSTAELPSALPAGMGRIAILADITERKRSAEALQRALHQEGVLRKELQHRVKNNLNIISSLIGLEIPRLNDATSRQIFIDARSRIHVMMRVYDHLNRSSDPDKVDLRSYVEEFAGSLVRTYSSGPGRIRLTLEFDDIPLTTKRIVPLGLILNELITNCLKYAYPSGADGEIRVYAKRLVDTITVSVEDDGVGFKTGVCPEKAESLGLSLVRNLADQIDGKVSFQSTPGVRVTIAFPANEPVRK